MHQALRLDQTPEIRQLEQPTSVFLSQIGVRGHVRVLQTSPLHLLVNVNCTEPSRQALERQLHNLYNIQESRGDQLMVVSSNTPPVWRDSPYPAYLLGCLANASLGLALGAILVQAGQRWQRRPRGKSKLLWLSPLATGAAVLWASAPPAALLVHLLALLLLKLRRRRLTQQLRRRTIVNGKQEAAIILMSYAPEISAQLFKELSFDAVHDITLEISKLPSIPPDLRVAVLATFDGCLKQTRSGAGSERVEPKLFATVLETYYLNSPLYGTLVSGPPAVARRPGNYRWLRNLAAGALTLVSLAPLGLCLVPQAQPPLKSELQRLSAARPTAVAIIVREGQARALVGLGTDNLNALRPLVAECAARLGYDPVQVDCLGITRRYHFPFRLLGALLGAAGLLALLWPRRTLVKVVEKVVEIPAPPTPVAAKPASGTPESVSKLMPVDEVSLEVGRGLLALVDPNQGAKLLERVGAIRSHLATELGLVVPGIRFRDHLALKRDEYVIRVRDVEVARGITHPNRYLAMLPDDKLDQLQGERVLDPTYGQPAVWINPEQRADAERLGALIYDPVSVVASQLTQALREHAAEVLTFNACLELLKQPQLQAALEQLERRGCDRVALWKILKDLLRQQVCIRDLNSILEGLLENATGDTPHEMRVELARQAVRDHIVQELCGSNRAQAPQELVLWRVTPELLQLLQEGPEARAELLSKLTLVGERMHNAGHAAVLLVTPEFRSELQSVIRPLKGTRVLSTAELPEWVQVRFFHGEGKL
ncbi:MAG: FHIPEP family type III secretion protein [Candidatus Eremiobacteraeota bacterium]|nr:FHIPEP family type III secretion protein [Candidatus Eremiobacteraeota bacterium]MCW5869339.1 FHIPEP family type III secretion protein [Candidatus Eremiobacteraeota bacterium]